MECFSSIDRYGVADCVICPLGVPKIGQCAEYIPVCAIRQPEVYARKRRRDNIITFAIPRLLGNCDHYVNEAQRENDPGKL
jgi:hypothetical protein